MFCCRVELDGIPRSVRDRRAAVLVLEELELLFVSMDCRRAVVNCVWPTEAVEVPAMIMISDSL